MKLNLCSSTAAFHFIDLHIIADHVVYIFTITAESNCYICSFNKQWGTITKYMWKCWICLKWHFEWKISAGVWAVELFRPFQNYNGYSFTQISLRRWRSHANTVIACKTLLHIQMKTQTWDVMQQTCSRFDAVRKALLHLQTKTAEEGQRGWIHEQCLLFMTSVWLHGFTARSPCGGWRRSVWVCFSDEFE